MFKNLIIIGTQVIHENSTSNDNITNPDAKNEDDNVSIEETKSKEKRISVISDPGYQANMRFLMQRPKSSVVINGPNSRPNSANFINSDSRPPTRSTSASSLMGRRSPGYMGPYLTESVRPSRPTSGK